ncbi:MAG: glycoside hydrolase family 95-like protein [Rikenellaceae bacterium]
MILQSHRSDEKSRSILDILPALPEMWRDGSVKGMRARGGFEVDMSWRNGELTSMVIHSAMGGSCSLRYKDKLVAVEVKAGEERSVMELIN